MRPALTTDPQAQDLPLQAEASDFAALVVLALFLGCVMIWARVLS